MTRAWREPSAADAQSFDPEDVFEAGLRNHHISNTAYPIAHQRTWRPYRVGAAAAAEVARSAWEGIDDLCLYVHIPFCETRCSFCEYAVVERDQLPFLRQYLRDLRAELDLHREVLGTRSRTLHGFDIGGGTPSLVPAEELARVLELVRGSFRFAPGSDISIETTPSIAAADPEKMAAYRKLGIPRISMGIQVVEPDLLRVLNRAGNGASVHRSAVDNIRAAGFDRFNLDLMYGFAGQSPASWRATLTHAIGLAPEQVTLYRMRYKLTRISQQADQVSLDGVRRLARVASELLADAGYRATPGKNTYSRLPGDPGTSSYLARRVRDGMPYLGLGLGAQSFTHTTISYNDGAAGKKLAPYRRSIGERRLPLQDVYDLPRRQMMAKMCAVSFYFGEIHFEAFRAKFGASLDQAFAAELAFVLRHGLMERTPATLRLTPEGAEQVNGVIALFFAPSVQHYLIEEGGEVTGDRRSSGPLTQWAGEAANV